ncbi:MAG TPA: hypothetical protein VF057_10275 [Thermoanaerobaculia bacterium]
MAERCRHVTLSREDGEESQNARYSPLRPFGVFAPQGDAARRIVEEEIVHA